METLKDIFVPYEIAQKLKEIGFSEPCMVGYYYDQDKFYIDFNKMINAKSIEFTDIDLSDFNNWDYMLSIPTYEQVLKWFRDKEIESSIVVINEIMYDDYNFGYGYHIVDFIDRTVGKDYGFIEHFETYEEAREQLVLKLIEIYEQNNKNE